MNEELLRKLRHNELKKPKKRPYMTREEAIVDALRRKYESNERIYGTKRPKPGRPVKQPNYITLQRNHRKRVKRYERKTREPIKIDWNKWGNLIKESFMGWGNFFNNLWKEFDKWMRT